MNKSKSILIALCVFVSLFTDAQENFPGINYTAVYRDNVGQPIANAGIDVRARINSENGSIIIWEEDHSIVTDGFGHFQIIIGEGIFTGNGIVTDFFAINWGAAVYTIAISIDEGSGFNEFTTNDLFSVPYAFYAKNAENQLYLNNLVDVDTTGISLGDILKWNGEKWIVDVLSDTVAFSLNSLNAIHSTYADTASFALSFLSTPQVDTAGFAFYGDTSNYSLQAANAILSQSSIYSDTANFAFNGDGIWLKNGNTLDLEDGIIGSLDSNDISFISNQEERIRIKANGKIGFGTADPVSDLHIVNNEGMIAEGDFGIGAFPIEGAGSRLLWVPKKAAFRVGRVNGNKWDEVNTGNYSFAGGFDTRAKGDYSFAFGQSSSSNGDNATAMGYAVQASGNTSVAMGSVTVASGVSSISLGRGTDATDSASFAIGYHTESHGKASGAFGYQSIVNDDFSYVFGYRAKANHPGCFVFSDASNYGNTQVYTVTTAANQFVVKASGGTYFYSDKDQLSGVFLAPGSGSWSSLSDKNSKENIEEVDYESILSQLDEIDVYTWNYLSQEEDIRHIGPFAQDIYGAYQFGETEEAISIVDMDGINLASIKALLIKIEDLKDDLDEKSIYKDKYLKLLDSFKLLESRIIKLESEQ